MIQYKTLNVKCSNSQLNKLKSGIKNGAYETLKFLSNVFGNSNDENNFRHELLLMFLTCKRFTYDCSANIKLSKTQLYKIVQ